MVFLSTPSARRATARGRAGLVWLRNFYPRPPRGGRQIRDAVGFAGLDISIHALREEGDLCKAPDLEGAEEFLSTPSARRATPPSSTPPGSRSHFYPRPPRGGRHFADSTLVMNLAFLSTPSARRATWLRRTGRRCCDISIHALREEGDFPLRTAMQSTTTFLSTPSARRATSSTRSWTTRS